MDLRYHLTGAFTEACDCDLICPCWVDEEPDNGSCAGLFAWTFGPGSTLEQADVTGLSVISVSMHTGSRRGGGAQSVLFVDAGASPQVHRDLVVAFSGRGGGPLAYLARVSGTVVDDVAATITITPDPLTVDDGQRTVTVTADGSQFVRAELTEKSFPGNAHPMTLANTALSDDLQAPQVTANRADRLLLDIATLPGQSVSVVGSSAMTGRFTYRSAPGSREPGEPDGR